MLDSNQVTDLRDELRELRNCWNSLQQQVDDKQTRLEEALESQSSFQNSLRSISDWLDEIESRLYTDVFSNDLDENVRLMSSLRQDIQVLQAEINAASRDVYGVMADANSQSRQLVHQTLTDLNQRMQIIEEEAQIKEAELAETVRMWAVYQVGLEKYILFISYTVVLVQSQLKPLLCNKLTKVLLDTHLFLSLYLYFTLSFVVEYIAVVCLCFHTIAIYFNTGFIFSYFINFFSVLLLA